MSMDFQIGSRVGDYVLDAYIGGGSFGAVWRAHAEGNDQPVAIKLLTGALAITDSTPLRADVELLAAAASRRSQHVVKVLGGGSEPVPYIVMEFIQGSDLQSQLRDQGRLTSEQTIAVGLAISDALRALYQAGIIHRDIKPANVMTDQDGVIKLADFGIAKIVGYATITTAGHTAMTMAYAAPEIWDEGSAFGHPSHRSDLYAMGILLYQCLTGAPPFSGNYGALYKAHTALPPDIAALPADTPTALRILIRRCLEKRQDNRPLDAAECTSLLQRADAEARAASLNEPKRLGPWLKDAPHESVPWAWHCHHERSGALATVEVHFADSLEYGMRLASAVEANAKLTSLGAERLIDSNRLLLYPGEDWWQAPPGEFQFWLAREDLPVEGAASVTEPLLRSAIPALERLIEAARREGISLDFGHDNLSLPAAGGVYLHRPGLVESRNDPAASALAALASLPLDDRARLLVDSAPDMQALSALLTQPDAGATIIATPPQAPPATAPPPTSDTPASPRPQPAPTSASAGSVPPATPPVAAAGGGRSGLPRPLIAGVGVAAVATIAIAAAVVLAGGGGKSKDQGVYAEKPARPPIVRPTVNVAQGTPTSPAARPTLVPLAAPADAALTALATVLAPLRRDEVIKGLERTNDVYIAAFRSGDIKLLSTAFTGEALAYYEDSMRKMLARNERQENQLLQTTYLDVQIPSATRAVVRTRERWSYRPIGPNAGPPATTTYNEYYEMVKVDQTWFVSVNTFQVVP